jgi:carboxypeptidase T
MNKKMKSILFSLIVLLILLASHNTLGIPSVDIHVHFNSRETSPYEYHTFDSMTQLLVNISEQYSDIINLQSIGNTFEDRSIWMVKISDNPTQDESEPAVLLMGAHHGNEKPSYESLIFFVEYIVDAYYSQTEDNDNDGLIDEDDFDGIDNDNDGLIDEDPSEDRIRNIVDSTEIFVIPMVNPDGVEYNWRKNRAPNYGSFGKADEITSYGVDLNRNYDYLWYLPYILPLNYMLPLIINDQSWNYRGEHAFSEFETQSVRDFVLSHDNIEISLSYHSYSEVIFYPWMHTSLPTPDEETFISVGQNISQIDGYDLRTHGWGDHDYIIPRFGGTIGSSENWLYATQGIIAYTMELCKTRAPTNPEVVFDYCWKHVGVNLYVAERSHQLS